jgi:hypothetical protein
MQLRSVTTNDIAMYFHWRITVIRLQWYPTYKPACNAQGPGL